MRGDYDMTNLVENVREERMMGTLERTDQQVKAAIEPGCADTGRPASTSFNSECTWPSTWVGPLRRWAARPRSTTLPLPS